MSAYIFTDQQADGFGTSITTKGGDAAIALWGTFGGGTVRLKIKVDEGSVDASPFLDLLDSNQLITDLTVAGVFKLAPIEAGVTLSAELTGATAPSLFLKVL